jgi:hypothetical protein
LGFLAACDSAYKFAVEMATNPISIDKVGEFEDLYCAIKRRFHSNLSQYQQPKRKDGESREKIYDHSYKDNPFFLQFSENLSGLNYNKGGFSPRGKVKNKISQKKKAVKVVKAVSVGGNDLSSRDLFDRNRECSFEEKSRRRPCNVPGFENQNWSFPRTDQKGTFHSQNQFDVDDRSKNHKPEQRISSSVAQIQRSLSTSRSVGTFKDKVPSKVISNNLERRQSKMNPRRDWRQSQERNSEEKDCIVTSQEGSYLQHDRSFNDSRHQKQALASFDSSMISQQYLMGRQRVTFPCTEHFDSPVQEILTYSHYYISDEKSFIPMLGPPTEELTNICVSQCHAHADKQQEVDSICDRTLGIPNMIKTHRVSESNYCEPNLPSKSHLNTTRRDGNQISICIQEGVMNSRFNTSRSLEENKRWKAYRSSQNSSHPIIWSSGGCSTNAQWSKIIK